MKETGAEKYKRSGGRRREEGRSGGIRGSGERKKVKKSVGKGQCRD